MWYMWFGEPVMRLYGCVYVITMSCVNCGLSVVSESVWVSGLSLSQSDELNKDVCDENDDVMWNDDDMTVVMIIG